MKTRRRRGVVAATAALLGLAALAVIAALTAGLGQASAKTGGATAESPLRKACGSKIVIQTDWFPEPEHGAVYQLAGTKGSFDKAKGRYTGSTKGVQIEIRAGGPCSGPLPSRTRLSCRRAGRPLRAPARGTNPFGSRS